MQTRVLSLFALFILFFIAVLGINAAYTTSVNEAGNGTLIENESFQANHSELVFLNHSNRSNAIYNDTVDVFDENNTLVDSDGNYTWNSNNGSLRIADSPPAFTDGENSTIMYGWRDPTDTQQLARFIALLPAEIGHVLFAGFAAAVVLAGLWLLKQQGGI